MTGTEIRLIQKEIEGMREEESNGEVGLLHIAQVILLEKVMERMKKIRKERYDNEEGEIGGFHPLQGGYNRMRMCRRSAQSSLFFKYVSVVFLTHYSSSFILNQFSFFSCSSEPF